MISWQVPYGKFVTFGQDIAQSRFRDSKLCNFFDSFSIKQQLDLFGQSIGNILKPFNHRMISCTLDQSCPWFATCWSYLVAHNASVKGLGLSSDEHCPRSYRLNWIQSRPNGWKRNVQFELCPAHSNARCNCCKHCETENSMSCTWCWFRNMDVHCRLSRNSWRRQ